MANYITEQFNNGFFNYYIERYDYQQKCFEKGNEFYEDERIGNANEKIKIGGVVS